MEIAVAQEIRCDLKGDLGWSEDLCIPVILPLPLAYCLPVDDCSPRFQYFPRAACRVIPWPLLPLDPLNRRQGTKGH